MEHAKTKVIMTVEEAAKDHEKWLAVRNKGIGGSDAGTIMRMNPYKGRLSLWLEKTGQKEPDDLSDNESVYWGTKLEDLIADYFTEKTGLKTRRCGTLQSVEYPFLLANVDRLIVGQNAGLEIKTAGVRQSSLWRDDEIPDSYYCQCQHYMLVTGCEKWYICALIGGNKGVIKEIPRNDGFIRDLLAAEVGFWTLVQNNIQPEIDDGLEDTAEALSLMYPQAVKDKQLEIESDEKLEEIFKEHARYKHLIKEMEKLVDECENKIKAVIQDNERAIIGEHKVSWVNVAGRTGFDSKRLKEEQPEIYAKYKTVGKPSRKFTMK